MRAVPTCPHNPSIERPWLQWQCRGNQPALYHHFCALQGEKSGFQSKRRLFMRSEIREAFRNKDQGSSCTKTLRQGQRLPSWGRAWSPDQQPAEEQFLPRYLQPLLNLWQKCKQSDLVHGLRLPCKGASRADAIHAYGTLWSDDVAGVQRALQQLPVSPRSTPLRAFPFMQAVPGKHRKHHEHLVPPNLDHNVMLL